MTNFKNLNTILSIEGYHLFIIHEPYNFHNIKERVEEEFPIESLHNILINNVSYGKKKWYLSSHKGTTKYLTIEDMKKLKEKLLHIQKQIIIDQFDSIIILYYLEHFALSLNEDFFPNELMQNDSWKVHYIPGEVNINPINIQSKKEDRLFKVFSYCLYNTGHYKQIDQKNYIKEKRVYKLTLQKHDNLVNQYDVIKYDSIKRIEKEKANTENIKSNLFHNMTNIIRNTFFLQGEYTGALCSCRDTYDFETLKNILLTTNDYNKTNAMFSSLFNCLDKLYSQKERSESYSPFEQYIKKIIYVVLEITSIKSKFEPADNKEISKIEWEHFFEDSFKLDECVFELIDIIPDFNNIDIYTMIYGVNVLIENKTIFCLVSHAKEEPFWREIFNRDAIKVGKKYQFQDVYFDNFLSHFFDALSDLLIDDRTIYASDINSKIKQKYRDEAMKMETLKFNKKKYINPASIMRNTQKLMELTEDHFRLAHGDANLENILFFKKDEENQQKLNYHPFLVDFKFLEPDYPASFDMVLLEMEIKIHIIADNILKDYYINEKRKWFDLVINIEQYLYSEGNNDLFNIQEIKNFDLDIQERLKLMTSIIVKIRKHAYRMYQRSRNESPSSFNQDVKVRYLQQLLFYCFRTLFLGKVKDSSSRYAVISAIYISNVLFSKNNQPIRPQGNGDIQEKKIFISYCHDDKKWIEQLEKKISVLKYKKINYWYDKKIKPGDYWNLEIQKNIEKAHMTICLITENYLNSNFIRTREIPAIINKKKEGMTIFPILLEDCSWKVVDWLNELQIYPDKPLDSFSKDEQNQHFKNIVADIAKKFETESF